MAELQSHLGSCVFQHTSIPLFDEKYFSAIFCLMFVYCCWGLWRSFAVSVASQDIWRNPPPFENIPLCESRLLRTGPAPDFSSLPNSSGGRIQCLQQELKRETCYKKEQPKKLCLREHSVAGWRDGLAITGRLVEIVAFGSKQQFCKW